MNKIWKIKKIAEDSVKEYADKFNITEFTAKLLLAKEIDEEKIPSYLNPDIGNLYDPYLLQDMDKLVERIIEAKDKKEKVDI